MKFIAHLLMLFLALLLVTAEDIDKCEPCFKQDQHEMCAKNGSTVYTVYNLCALQCYYYEFLHDGPCTDDDLLYNELEQK